MCFGALIHGSKSKPDNVIASREPAISRPFFKFCVMQVNSTFLYREIAIEYLGLFECSRDAKVSNDAALLSKTEYWERVFFLWRA